MRSRSLQSLTNRAGSSSQLLFGRIVGTLGALAIPVLFVVIGDVAHILVEAGAGTKHSFAIGLPTIDQWLPASMTPLTKVSILLAAALLIVFLIAISLSILNRQVQAVAVDFEINIIRSLGAFQTTGHRKDIIRTAKRP